MNEVVRIVLLDDEGNRQAGLTEYLAELENGDSSKSLTAYPDAGFEWLTGEQNEMTETVYPGQLNLIVLQFEEAAQRLQSGRPAILHFGEYGGEGGSHILLTPCNNQVDLSVIFIPDIHIACSLPIPDVIGEPAVLYNYVEENKAALIQGPPNKGMYFKHVSLPLQTLVNGLANEAKNGRESFKLLNIPLDNKLNF